ncbi:hypothetical protein Kpol_1030p34 [Vanderwaltozyma polyspora DSM 70294]|uniref:Uncharacterized protein n=1 Tax=Vanderwaltozyma polyspora (strain ATCC 22028 / DSM 70294 / BCRC 21397 / CBS 2163 / NBRC 10782 / NRRL Y-8283 / UCD 57-17) TaxID=436907 RepID=A7TMV2_VANPO|nr:uncharacterized protein Kpol_1030p34 [Vanderwaltozyma polyspora DSM 70294]EDO16424.1 hypothetical protein Kpol_1030p34 [Vanderwaltozyma polyspora DSM 70294]
MDEKSYRKITARHDELIKQKATLQKEYTTLLRKVVSIAHILNKNYLFDNKINTSTITDNHKFINDIKTLEKDYFTKIKISERAQRKCPDLKWYNKQLEIICNSTEFKLPKELNDSYIDYKNTSILYNDQ